MLNVKGKAYFFLSFVLQMLQVFESHAEILGYDTFTVCSLPYLKQIAEKVKEKLGTDAVPMVRILELRHS